MVRSTRKGWGRLAWGAMAAIAAVALIGVACGDDGTTETPTVTKTAAPSTGGAATIKIAEAGALGRVLTSDKGLTLYTFKNDVAGSGQSAVPATIAANWPTLTISSGSPVKPDGLTGELSVITREDGSKQVTYKGLPLYLFIGDTAPGHTNGQGLGGVWFAATP